MQSPDPWLVIFRLHSLEPAILPVGLCHLVKFHGATCSGNPYDFGRRPNTFYELDGLAPVHRLDAVPAPNYLGLVWLDAGATAKDLDPRAYDNEDSILVLGRALAKVLHGVFDERSVKPWRP